MRVTGQIEDMNCFPQRHTFSNLPHWSRISLLGIWTLFATIVLGAPAIPSQKATPAKSQSEADLAWAEIVKEQMTFQPPTALKSGPPSLADMEALKDNRRLWALKRSDAASEFYYRFPNHPRSQDARKLQMSALQMAWALGEKDQSAKLNEIAAQLSQSNLSEDQKFNLRWEYTIRTAISKIGDGKTAMTDELASGGRKLQHEFPGREEPSQLMLTAAFAGDSVSAARLSADILDRANEGEVKTSTERLVAKLFSKVRPVAMQLTTIDKEKIDLRKLTGKVVLLHFWSLTTYEAQKQNIAVKNAFDKYHSQGLEVIGITFEPTDALVREFVRRGGISWPQVIHTTSASAKPWREYGIDALPVIWLIDRRGFLREEIWNIEVTKKLETLLAEP